MRVFLAAAAITGLLTASANAEDATDRFQPPSAFQTTKSGGGRPMGVKPQKTAAERKADEVAYRSALERIPVNNEKFDPWQSVRK